MTDETSIYLARLESPPSGGVLRLPSKLTLKEAIEARRAGQDVVVCGANHRENRRMARLIESALGPYKREDPHLMAGTAALPHYQPQNRPPAGHTFYETNQLKSKRAR